MEREREMGGRTGLWEVLLPNAKWPCTSQTELGNLHVGNRKSWAGKSSSFGFSVPFPHTRPSFLYSLRNT